MSPDAATPETRRTAAEDVYLALKRDILTLKVEPASPLRESDLAARFGTSRVPVREACRRLQQEGLVESIPYKGYFAGRLSLKELSDSFDLRLVLETHALRSGNGAATGEPLRRLEALAEWEYEREDTGSWEVFLAKNREYHLALAALSGNHRLVRILRDLLEGMQRYFCLGLALGDYGREMRREHQRLTELVAAGRREEAADCLRGQIERSRERILAALLTDRVDLPVA